MVKEKRVILEYHLNKNQPDKPQFAIHDLNSYLKRNKGDATRPHIHSFYQIIWFKSGKGSHFVDFKEYEVCKNVLFFIAKNQVHYFDQNIQYHGILIHFNEIFLAHRDNETDLFLKSAIFNNPYRQPQYRLNSHTGHILDAYIRQITQELEYENSFGKEALLRSYLKVFLIQVQRRKNELDETGNSLPFTFTEKKSQLVKFMDLVEEQYNKGLSVSEYAHLLHVSSRTLSDITRQLLNKTPSQIVQERIILEAQRLLVHSGLNVNQIGYRLGFDDPSYFVKYFKKHAGTSPLEFRRSLNHKQ